jgi:hypothetical protein
MFIKYANRIMVVLLTYTGNKYLSLNLSLQEVNPNMWPCAGLSGWLTWRPWRTGSSPCATSSSRDSPKKVRHAKKVFLLINFWRWNLHHFSKIKSQKEVTQQYRVGIKIFLTIFAWWQKDPDPDPYLWLTDPNPDPEGLKTYGSGGSGSATLMPTILLAPKCPCLYVILTFLLWWGFYVLSKSFMQIKIVLSNYWTVRDTFFVFLEPAFRVPRIHKFSGLLDPDP